MRILELIQYSIFCEGLIMIFVKDYQKARKICYMKNFGKVKKIMLSKKIHNPEYMNKAKYAKNI